MSKNTIKFVYCDIGGVLFNEAGSLSLLEEFNIDLANYRSSHKKYHYRVFTGKMTADDLLTNVSRDLGIEIPVTNYNEYWTSHSKPYPKGQEMLKKIAKNYPVGILTNNMKDSLSYYRRYGHLPDLDYDVIIESSVVGFKKPEAEIFKIAEKEAGFKGDEIFFIDDRVHNLDAARKLGWQAAHYDKDDQERSVKEILERLDIGM